ncbi:hypothetical protein VQ042_05370 [Aurantimonas sp. A2-1-M11]|uniref:hypothetical protein n=1 Tax=Aurantimonas sp. A2-1-M11 TaxID=3113712 RepID=UPI002F92DC5F
MVEMAPYAMQDEDGNWSGPAVDLFREATDAAGVGYELVEAGSQPALQPSQTIFPVYAEPLAAVGMVRSLPFHVDAIGLIGAPGASSTSGFIEGLAGLFNIGFLKVVGMISACCWSWERSSGWSSAPTTAASPRANPTSEASATVSGGPV